MKQKTCCFTGHRDIPSGSYQLIFNKTEEVVESLINKGYLYFGAGGALGFDTIAAFTVLKLKERYPDVRLILVLPCLSQTRGWSREDVKIYEDIKSKADKVVVTLIARLIPFMALFSSLWSIFSLVAWIYILVNAIKNTRMTILSKFGINL